MFKSKLPQPEEGFSLLEVLVAIFVLSLFILAGLQMMVLTTMVTAKAQLKREANNWIDSDIQDVKLKAADDFANDSISTRCQAVNYADGYAQALRDELATIESPVSNSYTSNSPTSTTYESFTLYNPDNPDAEGNFLNKQPYNSTEQQYDITKKRSSLINKKLRLIRHYRSSASISPHKVLYISYEVYELDLNGNPVGNPPRTILRIRHHPADCSASLTW